MRTEPALGAMAAVLAMAAGTRADLTYLHQARSVTASTSANGQTEQVTAPDFAPFVQSLDLSTPFQLPGGATGFNIAHVAIDCQLDPNRIRASGSIGGTGGPSQGGGTEVGDAAASVEASFHLDQATPFSLSALPRPNSRQGDQFRVRLRDGDHHILLLLDETSPPEALNVSGTLSAGDYDIQYEVESSEDSGSLISDFSFDLLMGAQACYANCDLSTTAPVLNVNDFLCFMTRFANGESYANCDQSTVAPVLNVNDFVCFMTMFSAGCP